MDYITLSRSCPHSTYVYRNGTLEVAGVRCWRLSHSALWMVNVARRFREGLSAVVAPQALLPFEALATRGALKNKRKLT